MTRHAEEMHEGDDVPAAVVAFFVLMMGAGGLTVLTSIAQALTAVV